MSTFERIRSGLPGLDSMLDSIRMGDNVVWQVSSMDDYMHFVTPLCNQLHEEGKELLYMHFSDTLLFFRPVTEFVSMNSILRKDSKLLQ